MTFGCLCIGFFSYDELDFDTWIILINIMSAIHICISSGVVYFSLFERKITDWTIYNYEEDVNQDFSY